MKTICTVRNIHLKTVVDMLGAPACEVGAVDPISASDIGLAGALITKRNLSCISVRPCHRPHGCGLGEGEVPLGELGVEQARPRHTASCNTCGITPGPRLHCAGLQCTALQWEAETKRVRARTGVKVKIVNRME